MCLPDIPCASDPLLDPLLYAYPGLTNATTCMYCDWFDQAMVNDGVDNSMLYQQNVDAYGAFDLYVRSDVGINNKAGPDAIRFVCSFQDIIAGTTISLISNIFFIK